MAVFVPPYAIPTDSCNLTPAMALPTSVLSFPVSFKHVEICQLGLYYLAVDWLEVVLSL